jgi:ferredoxin
MNISRKEFFKRSLFSLGEAVSTVTNVLNSTSEQTVRAVPGSADFVATPNDDRQAVAHNEHCLAKNSGCFACVERCEVGAIRLIPGVGIRINAQLCNGCGTCEYVCPVKPKAVSMQSRSVPNQ